MSATGLAGVDDVTGAFEALRSEASSWGSNKAHFLADLAAVWLALPEPRPAPLSAPSFHAIAAMMRAAAEGQPASALLAHAEGLSGDDGAALLRTCDSFLPARYAEAIADALANRGLSPGSRRLAAMLARVAPARAVKFLEDLGERDGQEGSTYIEAVTDARLARVDAGEVVPPALETIWRGLAAQQPSADDEDSHRIALLRTQARDDLDAAFASLPEVIQELSAVDVAEGVAAVVVRKARLDLTSVMDWVSPYSRVATRAILLSDVGWDGVLADAPRRELARLLEDLADPAGAPDNSPRPRFAAAMALVELAASIGDHELAERIVRESGLDVRWAFHASWAAARRRAISLGASDAGLWASIERGVASRSGSYAAYVSAPHDGLSERARVSLWRMKTLPLASLPTRVPWDGGLP